MNYYDHEVNGEYNRERVKSEIAQIRLEANALKTTQPTTRRARQFAGNLFERLVAIEKSMQHQLSMVLHAHPRPAVIQLRRRR